MVSNGYRTIHHSMHMGIARWVLMCGDGRVVNGSHTRLARCPAALKTSLCQAHIASPRGGRAGFLPLQLAKPRGRPTHIFQTVKFLKVNYASSDLFCDRSLSAERSNAPRW